MMWIWVYRDEVASDLSRFHGIKDMLTLKGPIFFALARSLPAYDGACLGVLRMAMEEAKKEPEMTREELYATLYTSRIDPETPFLPPEEEEPEEGGHTMTAEELAIFGPPAPELGEDVGLFSVVKCT
jgi:hypothetical protein